MVRTRFLIAVVALGLGAGACKKKEEKKDTATADQTTKAGENPATKAVAGALGAAATDLAVLPSDSELVLGLNFAQLQKSELWKQFAPKIMEKASKDLAEFKAMCGFDPLEKFKSVSMGLKGLDGGKTPDGAIVVHGLEKAQTLACLDKGKAELAKKGTEVTVDGDVFLMKNKGGETTAWTFTSNDTMVGIIGTGGTKDGVLAAVKGTAGLASSAKFVEMYKQINTGESVWFLVNGQAPFMAKAQMPGSKPQAIFGSLNVTDGLSLDVRMRMGTPDEAKGMVDMMQGQTNSPQVKQMFDKLEVKTEGNDARIQVAMSQEKLKNLVGMFAGMMGGMMGAGGGMGGP
jgi:hypothetical protein